jgi:hypothetical protein
VTAPVGSPGRIADPDEILRRAGPGGDLTLGGAAKLMQTIGLMRKDADQASIQQTKAHLMSYARSKLTFDQEMLFPGVPPLKDQRGVQIFDGQFVPKFEAAYDQFVKGGGDPWKFLTPENVDKLTAGMRDQNKMAGDKIAAMEDSLQQPHATPTTFTRPEGVEPQFWNATIANPPRHTDGSRSDPAKWGEIVEKFGHSPTTAMVRAFDNAQLANEILGLPRLDISGDEILKSLQGKQALRKHVAAPAGGSHFIQIGKPDF